MKLKILLLLSTMLVIRSSAHTQDTSRVVTQEELSEVKGAVDGMNETLLEMKSTLDALKKIKVSGYIQVQYQVAESAGVASYAGGNFPSNVQSRYSVRRGRLKVNYDNDLTQYVLQIDVTQSGVVIKDAYALVKEPWLKMFSLTGGVFDRPFGFEISYSSSSRESPERSRMFQTLFPGERELGAKIEVMPETGLLSYLNLKVGLFNGVLNTANENDRNKDVIGRLGFQLPLEEQNLAIDGGVSFYAGQVTSNSPSVFEIDNSSTVKRYKLHSTSSDSMNSFNRSYYGGDLQLYYDFPVLGGFSIRGEYITGNQPGTASSNSFYYSTTPMYLRKFTGWYINYIQNIGLNNQFIFKYDLLDPNTEVEGSDIGKTGSNLTVGDVKYSTLGIGWIHHWDANVKFVLYYDVVKNETVNPSAAGSLAAFKDDIKDNVFTVRMQYKF